MRNSEILDLRLEKIFIAGSKGMVGSSILRLFLKHGFKKHSEGGQLLTPRRDQLDLSNKYQVENWFKKNKPTVVILAAAKVGGILANNDYPGDFLLENLKIQTNIIETSKNYFVKKFLFLGSSCIYPKFSPQPIKEEYLLNGSLEDTNEYYAIAKIAGIKLCESFAKQYKFNAISLMPTNLYGPGDNYHERNSHVMASLIKKFTLAKKNSLDKIVCWGTGAPLREFLHVDDLAEAVFITLQKWWPLSDNLFKDINGKELFFLNVGTGKDISIKELAEIIANEVNYKGEILWDLSKPDGTPQKKLDITRIKKLGWEPKKTLKEGLRETINNFNSIS